VFRSIEPAWNDRNLRELAGQLSSRRVLAHIRAFTAHRCTRRRGARVHPRRCARARREVPFVHSRPAAVAGGTAFRARAPVSGSMPRRPRSCSRRPSGPDR
jgi:hypothetical protein